MRRCVVTTVLIAAACASRIARADDVVGMVVFQGPAAPSAAAEQARDRAAASARDAHLAWVDLSPAPPAAPIAAARLRAGVDAYEELRWDDALAALDEAVTDAWRTGGAGLATSDLSDVFLYRGLVHTQRGDSARAWDDLVRAATIAPVRTLDPVRFPTRAVEAFDRARTAVAAMPRAQLEVDAPGCSVVIDGGDGVRASVVHGEHAVRTECPGRGAWGERVVVEADVSVSPPEPAAPLDNEALAAVARERAVTAILAVVVVEDEAGATASIRVIGADGRAATPTAVTLDADGTAVGAAIDAAIGPAPEPVHVPARKRWWQSPWLWAAGGAAITAAVLVPFAVGGGDDDSASLRPLGWSW